MAVDVVRPAAEAKQLTLTTTLDPFVDSVAGDATRLQQIFWNLIFNAVKFTPPGGRIDVRLETSDGRARGSVVDSGRVIVPDFLTYLLHPFLDAETGSDREQGR